MLKKGCVTAPAYVCRAASGVGGDHVGAVLLCGAISKISEFLKKFFVFTAEGVVD